MRLLLLTLTVLFTASPSPAQYEITLVADINPGSSTQYSLPTYLTEYNGRLFFAAYEPQVDRELWEYDAASDQVNLAADINPAAPPQGTSSPEYLTVYDGLLFFSAFDEENGRELWSYDSNTGEAHLVSDIRPGAEGSDPNSLVVYDDRLFFVANDGQSGYEWWQYDASIGQTALVADIKPGLGSALLITNAFVIHQEKLFFRADDGISGNELWAYDAVTDEVELIADINPGSASSSPRNLATYGDYLYFGCGVEADIRGLWTYHSTSGISTRVSEVLPRSSLALYDNRFFFSASSDQEGIELWSHELNTGETALVADIFDDPVGSSSNPKSFLVYDDRLFFSANDGQHGFEVWMYSAATDEVALVADTRPGSSSFSPAELTPYDGRVFFSANDGIHGRELWSLSSTPVANELSATTQPIRLDAPHPNPTQDRATVSFELAEASPVRVEVLDVLGRSVALLADGPVAAGEHTMTWEAGTLPSGLYLVRLTVGDVVQTQRLTLTR